MHDQAPNLTCPAEARAAQAEPPAAVQQALQRQRARRTALCMGCIALAVYTAFILSGVIGR